MTVASTEEQKQADKLAIAEKRHDERRKVLEDNIRKTPISQIENLDVPSSAHIVMNSAEWYQKFAMLSLYSIIPVSIAAAFVTIALVVVLNRPPETLSYLMDEDGRVVQLLPVSSPTLTETEVLNWAATKIEALHNISFTDYKQHVYSLRQDFSPNAFLEYQRSLKASKGIEKIKTDRLNMYIKPIDAPRILQSGVSGGVYTWIIEMKVRQFFAGGEYQSAGTDLVSTIRIERASRIRNLSGVIITKYLAKEARTIKKNNKDNRGNK